MKDKRQRDREKTQNKRKDRQRHSYRETDKHRARMSEKESEIPSVEIKPMGTDCRIVNPPEKTIS